jgi:hypothetical protein
MTQSKQRVLAVDFDGSLCVHAFPNIGIVTPRHELVHRLVRHLHKLGWVIVLWTCREDVQEGAYLSQALAWCKAMNIPIDYANEYPHPDFGGFASRKVYADIYLDDKATNFHYIEELCRSFGIPLL